MLKLVNGILVLEFLILFAAAETGDNANLTTLLGPIAHTVIKLDIFPDLLTELEEMKSHLRQLYKYQANQETNIKNSVANLEKKLEESEKKSETQMIELNHQITNADSSIESLQLKTMAMDLKIQKLETSLKNVTTKLANAEQKLHILELGKIEVDGNITTILQNRAVNKVCQGPIKYGIVHSGNIESFRNCTIIEGSLAILETTFSGFQEVNLNYTFGARYGPLDPDRLEVFSTLREITGFIKVQGNHPNFTSLAYFRNLETIGGREKADLFSSLYIVKTSLRALHLRSLKRMRSGAVTILENDDLCFVNSIAWKKITSRRADEQIANNCPEEKCRTNLQVCSSQCSKDGCWGTEPTDCFV